jgi:glycerol-3-phosphate dehydrogenase
MWTETACKVRKMGGEIRTSQRVEGVVMEGNRVRAIRVTNLASGETELLEATTSSPPCR